MTGSVYFQSAELVKQVFQEGAKKEERVDTNHPYYQKVASFQTMESYRSIWNNFFNYLLEHWKMQDFEQIQGYHIEAYMDYKIGYYPSKQYLEKISAAMGKLEIALNKFSANVSGKNEEYDFSIRQTILDEARDLKYVANNYHNRAYQNPEQLIMNLQNPIHRIAAKIQHEGGARIEGVALIKPEQLIGFKLDTITNTKKGIIFTKEKGGNVGEVLISVETYNELQLHFQENSKFRINRQKYYNDIKQAINKTGESSEASHGLRWNFAQRRMFEYAKAGYSYEESLQLVSFEMKHRRKKITEHYLGG